MLPLSRNHTHSAGTPVKASLLDDLQDCVIAAAHGAAQKIVGARGMDLGSGVSVAGGGWAEWSSAGSAFWAPEMLRGDRVTGLTLRVYGNGSADFTVGVYVVNASASLTQICPGGTTYAITNPAASWADVAIDLIDTTLGAGDTLLIEVAGNASGLRLQYADLAFHHPKP